MIIFTIQAYYLEAMIYYYCFIEIWLVISFPRNDCYQTAAEKRKNVTSRLDHMNRCILSPNVTIHHLNPDDRLSSLLVYWWGINCLIEYINSPVWHDFSIYDLIIAAICKT